MVLMIKFLFMTEAKMVNLRRIEVSLNARTS